MYPDLSGLGALIKFLVIVALVAIVAFFVLAAPGLKHTYVDVTHRSESINQRPTGQKLCTEMLKKCPHVQQYTASNFQQLVVNSPVPVVCCYYVDSSQLCAEQLQLLEKVASRFGDKARFLAGNTAELPMSCNVLALTKVPATAVATKGNKTKEVRQMFLSEQELALLLAKAADLK